MVSVHEAFGCLESYELDFLLWRDVGVGDFKANFLVETNRVNIVRANIKGKVAWVVNDEVLYELATNTLSLAV